MVIWFELDFGGGNFFYCDGCCYCCDVVYLLVYGVVMWVLILFVGSFVFGFL